MSFGLPRSYNHASRKALVGACAVGAFNDDAVNALVSVDGVAAAGLYVLAVGAQATV